MHRHPLLTLVLVFANIPLYIAIGRVFFKDLQGLLDCLDSIGLYWWGESVQQQQDDFYARLKLISYVLGSVACVMTEYHLIVWLFLH